MRGSKWANFVEFNFADRQISKGNRNLKKELRTYKLLRYIRYIYDDIYDIYNYIKYIYDV